MAVVEQRRPLLLTNLAAPSLNLESASLSPAAVWNRDGGKRDGGEDARGERKSRDEGREEEKIGRTPE